MQLQSGRRPSDADTVYRRFLGPGKTENDPEVDEVSLSSARGLDSHQQTVSVMGRIKMKFARWQRRFSGWKAGLIIGSCCTGTVFLVNVLLTLWATQTFTVENGSGVLIDGSCSKTKEALTWIHLAINVFSTLLLGASNYCMQILTAPTRVEIDRAHATGRWLDIGVPSVRNLRWISWNRVFVWTCLALSSLPLHLLYNSAVYGTLAANQYAVWAASENTGSWNDTSTLASFSVPVSDVSRILQDNQQNQLQPLDRRECITAYGRDFVSDRGDVVLILNDTGRPDNEIVGVATSFPGKGSYSWICSHLLDKLGGVNGRLCNPRDALADIDGWAYLATG